MQGRIVAASVVPGMPAKWPALGAAGYVVEPFPADGAGGRALEAGVKEGRFAGVLDLATGELAAELFSLPGGAGPDRLTAAGLAGVPQVIGVGGVPGLTPEQGDKLGLEIAQKACAACGPTVLLLARRDCSPGAAALFESLRNWVYGVEIVDADAALTDEAFTAVAEAKLLQLLGGSP